MRVSLARTCAVMVSALAAIGTVSPVAADYIAVYNFAYAPATSDPADAPSAATPFWIVDGENAFNPPIAEEDLPAHIRYGPAVADRSGNGRTLVHGNNKPSGSGSHIRYVTSDQTGAGGIFAGVGNNTVLTTGTSTFSSTEFASGFTMAMRLEVSRSDAEPLPGTAQPKFLAHFGSVTIGLRNDGVLQGTIAGTFSSSITGTRSLFRPSTSTIRPVHDVLFTYDPLLTVDGVNNLFIVLDGKIEAAGNFALSTFTHRLDIMGANTDSSRYMRDVQMNYLHVLDTVHLPEPMSAAFLAVPALVLMLRRR